MTPQVMEKDVKPQLTETAARKRRSRGGSLVAMLLLVLLVAGGITVARRRHQQKELVTQTGKLAVATVSVLKPSIEPTDEDLTLPGTMQAYVESAIYARTNGYLLHWTKDIGSPVKKGELLATIDTPEIDQELMQAKAARQQVEAQLQLAKTSAERWINLKKSDSVSQQEVDQQTSGYTQAQANLAAADANVRRLQQMEGFKRIYAPFTGILTKRNYDVGALISAGSAGQAKELFDIAQVDPLRVYVSVPQAYAPSIKRGLQATVELQEMPGQKFAGKVVRTSDMIDPATRTLLTEVDVPNRDHKLLPGSYGQVHFAVPVETKRMTVPENTLLFRAAGTEIAVVGADNKISLRKVEVGRDFGTKVEIVSGLAANDNVVLNPADSIADGETVNVHAGKAGSANENSAGAES